MILNGIDNLPALQALLGGARVALLTNAGARDAQGRRTADALLENGFNVTQLFAPEHGLGGLAAAGEAVGDETDAATGLPVASLYGEHREIPSALADRFDVLAVDLPDVGVRYYTYPDTLFRVMESCARLKRSVVVLDRPSPLGRVCQGPLLDMRFASDVGAASVPVRHGFSLGEYAAFAQSRCGRATGCDLRRVPFEDGGAEGFPAFGLPWVNPSPNLRSFEALCAYPGTCLFEGTNLSEGRGTEAPFLTVGAPFVNPAPLLSAVANLSGGVAEACEFTPTGSKFAGERCRGVRLVVIDWQSFNGFEWGLRLLDAARRSAPDEFVFRPEHFDHLLGDDRYRLGQVSADELLAEAEIQCAAFAEELRSVRTQHGECM